MPKITVTQEIVDKDTGLKEFTFLVDGKEYRVTPKPGNHDNLDEFLRYVKFVAPKRNLSPFVFRKKNLFNIEPVGSKAKEKKPKPKSEAEQLSLFKCAKTLDHIADKIQGLGYKDLATRIDIISNTIEKKVNPSL